MAKPDKKQIDATFKRFRFVEPQRSIILEVVSPEKLGDFLDYITKIKRSIFHILCPVEKTKKEDIKKAFLDAFDLHALWDEYSKFDSMDEYLGIEKKNEDEDTEDTETEGDSEKDESEEDTEDEDTKEEEEEEKE